MRLNYNKITMIRERMMHLLFENVGRRCETSRVRRLIVLKSAEMFNSAAMELIRVTHDSKFRRIEFEGA